MRFPKPLVLLNNSFATLTFFHSPCVRMTNGNHYLESCFRITRSTFYLLQGLTSQNVVNKVMGVLVDRADFLFGGRKASLLEPPSAPQTRKRQVVSSTTTNPSHRRERGGLASASGRTSGFHGTASRLSEQQRSGVSRVMPVTSNTMATCRNGGGGYQTSRDNAHETNIFVQEVYVFICKITVIVINLAFRVICIQGDGF